MKQSHVRTIIAGVAGGIAMNLAMLLTFRLIGFGWKGNGILLDPSHQSQKLIAVWTKIEPLPLVVRQPMTIFLGIVGFGIIHAYLFRWLSRSWPRSVAKRAIRFACLVFVMTFLFWEFFTPFNQFGEPIYLIALELLFWAFIASADGFTISMIMREGRGLAESGGNESL
jgi:MFS superfamily sulfate permease-like transporter